jgi:3-dehydroquinate synthase
MTQQPTRIQVGGDRPYDVVIGSGVTAEVAGLLGDGVRRVLVVHPRSLAHLVLPVELDLRAAGLDVVLADAVLEKFGGDSVEETARNVAGFLGALRVR